MFKTLQRLKYAYIALSVALCAVGICLIIWPEQLKVLFCYLIGAIALTLGIISLVIFFVRDIGTPRPGNGLMIGMLASIFGLILLLKPDNGAAFFSMLVGVFIIVDSIIKIQTSFELKNIGAKFWWINLLISVASTVLGVLLVINPYGEGSTLLLIFIGISLIADSVANIFTAIFVWRTGRRLKKEESIVVVEE